MAELTDAAKEARRAYYREYYQKHKEADKAKSARFWERKGEELRASEAEQSKREENSRTNEQH